MKYYIIITILIINVFAREWNYSADILEKTIENGKEVRLFKSNKNSNVIISSDTISIFTKQAKQYINSKELHLIGPVIMVNGNETVNIDLELYIYELVHHQKFDEESPTAIIYSKPHIIILILMGGTLAFYSIFQLSSFE